MAKEHGNSDLGARDATKHQFYNVIESSDDLRQEILPGYNLGLPYLATGSSRLIYLPKQYGSPKESAKTPI